MGWLWRHCMTRQSFHCLLFAMLIMKLYHNCLTGCCWDSEYYMECTCELARTAKIQYQHQVSPNLQSITTPSILLWKTIFPVTGQPTLRFRKWKGNRRERKTMTGPRVKCILLRKWQGAYGLVCTFFMGSCHDHILLLSVLTKGGVKGLSILTGQENWIIYVTWKGRPLKRVC